MSAAWPCLRPSPDGCVLDLSVVPGAKRTEAIGLHDGALRLRLAAPPVDGKANGECVRFIAELAGVAKSRVRIASGLTSRLKVVEIDGVTQEAIESVLGG